MQCPKCGYNLEPFDTACKKCGQQLGGAQPAQGQPQPLAQGYVQQPAQAQPQQPPLGQVAAPGTAPAAPRPYGAPPPAVTPSATARKPVDVSDLVRGRRRQILMGALIGAAYGIITKVCLDLMYRLAFGGGLEGELLEAMGVLMITLITVGEGAFLGAIVGTVSVVSYSKAAGIGAGVVLYLLVPIVLAVALGLLGAGGLVMMVLMMFIFTNAIRGGIFGFVVGSMVIMHIGAGE